MQKRTKKHQPPRRQSGREKMTRPMYPNPKKKRKKQAIAIRLQQYARYPLGTTHTRDCAGGRGVGGCMMMTAGCEQTKSHIHSTSTIIWLTIINTRVMHSSRRTKRNKYKRTGSPLHPNKVGSDMMALRLAVKETLPRVLVEISSSAVDTGGTSGVNGLVLRHKGTSKDGQQQCHDTKNDVHDGHTLLLML